MVYRDFFSFEGILSGLLSRDGRKLDVINLIDVLDVI